MAFVLASSTVFARDLWPGGKGRLSKDTSTVETLPRHRVVPRTHDDMCDWLCVDPCGVDSASPVLLHPDLSGDDGPTELTVRLQGFVEDISVGMLGNWNGTVQGAPKAQQTITLVSGRCDAAFEPQVQAIANIRETVLRLLSRSDCNTCPPDGKIRLRRRVFDRVRADDMESNIAIPPAEDPVGRAKKIERMWAVRHRIQAGAQRADGKVERENPRVIRPGDFVDVAIAVQAVSMRLPKGRRIVEVLFAPQSIVRLIPSDCSVPLLVAIDADAPENNEAPPAKVVAKRDLGFCFDEDEEVEDEMMG